LICSKISVARELRDKADQRGQTSAAIRAEELRGQLRRFYVKQVESGDTGDFERMSDEELRKYVYGDADDELPPKGPNQALTRRRRGAEGADRSLRWQRAAA
jgi:hypothetical protein